MVTIWQDEYMRDSRNGTFQTFCTHIPAFLHKKTPAEPSLEGSATPSVCSQNPCHLRPAPQRMLWLQKVPQLCYYAWSTMARDFSYLISTCHIMSIGCYTGIRVSRVVTEWQHTSCADVTPGCVFPHNMSSHSSFIMCLHCREHGE